MTWAPLTPAEVRDLLSGLDVPWWLAGGWALDEYVGRQTREHADIDVSMLRRDQAAVRTYLGDWDLHVADPPGTLRSWTSDVATAHDVWCRRFAGGAVGVADHAGGERRGRLGVPPRPARESAARVARR